MRILLTNDDGISSPGIKLLAVSLRNAGHKVFLVAPDCNRSGSSHSILFLNKAIKLSEVEKDNWSCSGTPVDCIVLSLLGGIPEISISTKGTEINMEKAPDMILSGINAGANLGTDIIYSGTAAAARQGSIFGIPSAALSLVEKEKSPNEICEPLWEWDSVISYITENLSLIKEYWKANTFVNVNFPNINKKPSALVTAFPSIRSYNDRIVTFSAPDKSVYCFAKPGKVENTPEQGSDWAEVLKGNAALSVVLSQPAILNKPD